MQKWVFFRFYPVALFLLITCPSEGSSLRSCVTSRTGHQGREAQAAHFMAGCLGRVILFTIPTSPPGTHSSHQLRKALISGLLRPVAHLPPNLPSPNRVPPPPQIASFLALCYTHSANFCKVFLWAAAAYRQLVLNFDLNSLLILEYF